MKREGITPTEEQINLAALVDRSNKALLTVSAVAADPEALQSVRYTVAKKKKKKKKVLMKC